MKLILLRSFAILALLFLVACSAGLSDDSYNKIETGMSLEEVEDILGKHTGGGGLGVEVAGQKVGGGVYDWVDGAKKISITFANDKVTMKVKNGF